MVKTIHFKSFNGTIPNYFIKFDANAVTSKTWSKSVGTNTNECSPWKVYGTAKHIRFLRNGDPFFKGIVFGVSKERYCSLNMLLIDLTHLLNERALIPVTYEKLFKKNGDIIRSWDELIVNDVCICAESRDHYKREFD